MGRCAGRNYGRLGWIWNRTKTHPGATRSPSRVSRRTRIERHDTGATREVHEDAIMIDKRPNPIKSDNYQYRSNGVAEVLAMLLQRYRARRIASKSNAEKE